MNPFLMLSMTRNLIFSFTRVALSSHLIDGAFYRLQEATLFALVTYFLLLRKTKKAEETSMMLSTC